MASALIQVLPAGKLASVRAAVKGGSADTPMEIAKAMGRGKLVAMMAASAAR